MAHVRGGSRWTFDRVVDAAFAVALAVTNVVNMYFPEASSAYAYPPPTMPQVVLGSFACLGFAVRRTVPMTTLLVALIAAGIITAAGWNAGFLPYAIVLGLYTVAAHCDTRRAVGGLCATLGVISLLAFVEAPSFQDAYVLLTIAWYTAAWLAGLVMRRVRQDRDRAHQRALEAERTRALAAAEARVQERLRIARDMHDVVAHTLSVMLVQAGLARVLLPDRPVEAAEAIVLAEDSARGATSDLRRVLGVLRADTAQVDFDPAPSTTDLSALVGDDDVHLEMSGDVEALPDSIRLTVYRIVQEGLTNARKHAPDAHVDVVVAEQDGGVDVRVVNAAGSRPGDVVDGGWGLVGLLERVEMYGGTFAAGPTPTGGFAIRARL